MRYRLAELLAGINGGLLIAELEDIVLTFDLNARGWRLTASRIFWESIDGEPTEEHLKTEVWRLIRISLPSGDFTNCEVFIESVGEAGNGPLVARGSAERRPWRTKI